MFKISKIFSILLVVVCIIFFVSPNKVNALSTGVKQITETIPTATDDYNRLQFSQISFKKDSATFGLTGTVYNHNSYGVILMVNAKFYDINYNLIATTNCTKLAPAGNYTTYSQLDDINKIKAGYTVNDIYYYELDISTKSAATSNDMKNTQYDYFLNSYDIDIFVNENNTLNITEKIGAYFNVNKHGIFRKIPLRNTVKRLDRTTSKNLAKITDIKVNNEYSESIEDGYKVIQIGNPYSSVTGQQNYRISYLYNLGKDTGKGYDELYFNLIGDEWDTAIENVTFSITMPKEFDKTKLGFSSGKIGSTDSSNVIYEVRGNQIIGRTIEELEPGEALTIRLELPEDYFVGASYNFSYVGIISIVISIILLLIGCLIWRKYGKDEQVIETVEFYPPNDFNSLEVGFLYKGKADGQDVTSLLIYLANKGYIKISETTKKSLFSTINDFKITKLKEYDGNNINEKLFLDGLFRSRTTISLFGKEEDADNNDNYDEVTSYDLYDNFYITTREILDNINSKENKNKIFEKKSSSKNLSIILMIIAIYCIITIPPVMTYGAAETLIFALLFPGIGFSVLFSMVFGGKKTIYVNGKPTASTIVTKLFGLVWGGMFGGIPWVGIVLPTLLVDYMYFIAYIVGLLCVLGLILCLKYLPKRTPYGNEMLGKLNGFKNFLDTAEKNKLESMVMENPTYFYDILPYAYVLGVSDKWIKQFETISLQSPAWYDSPTAFSSVHFCTFLNNTMSSAQRSMSSSPSSSSGGSSGGGSSGGGSGGGGGGSW